MDREDEGLPKWDKYNGRKHETLENSKVAARIKEWMQLHPNCKNKSACAKDLGITRPTVRKWWNIIQSGSQADEVKKLQEKMEPITPHYQMMLTSEEMYESMSDLEELTSNNE